MKVEGLYLDEKKPSVRFKIVSLSNIAFSYLHILDLCAKRNVINYHPENKPVIYAMWHGCQWGLGVFPLEERKNINILISLSNDGEIISRVVNLMGFSLVRGSQGRNGDRALRNILDKIEKGQNIAFMVDGPLGPKQKVKKGIIKIAQMTQVPIVPLVPYTNQKICINSWDNYQIPYHFFIKASVCFADPIFVPKDITDDEQEEYRLKLENSLFDLEKKVIEEHKKRWEKKNG